MKENSYQAPSGRRITSSDAGGAQLRLAEEARDDAIAEAARALARCLGHKRGEFWSLTMPEELLSILDAFDDHAATLAARAYLEREGRNAT